jgi:hypothetical protein
MPSKNAFSCVRIENRSTKPFKELITRLVNSDYDKICNGMQNIIQCMYEYLLLNKYIGQNIEYCVSNESGNWAEVISLQEIHHGHASLVVMLSSRDINCDSLSGHDIRSLSKIKNKVRSYATNEEYNNPVFGDRIFKLVLDCSNYLNKTHSLELDVVDGVLYFRATPNEGTSVISIISRSDGAIVAKDCESLEKFHELGYDSESVEDTALTH